MWKALLVATLSFVTTIIQISFLSHLAFPFSAISFPLLLIAYGIVRDKPLLAVGWALCAGALLDLHGLLGFGSELLALFAAFFSVRYLHRRIVTNAGPVAFFLLGAAAAVTHWFILSAIDGTRVLFGGIPVMSDISLAAALAPMRQGLVNGILLLFLVALEDAGRGRFRKSFLSHAPHAFS